MSESETTGERYARIRRELDEAVERDWAAVERRIAAGVERRVADKPRFRDRLPAWLRRVMG